MKKITTIVLMTTLATGLFAGDNATATVDAIVQANLTLTNTAIVDFKTLQPTGTPIIDPKGAAHTDVTAPTIGTFTLTGAAGQVVAITEGGAVTLGDGGSQTMTFTPDLEGHATTQGSATDVGATVTLDGSGNFLFWLGGDLGTLTNQPAGTYASDETNGSGDWSLSVEYN
ncbi:MAG: DUF4402 domain-containing protein [Candidatus Marinimicrobia bacterium]|nr:DUF4402 domain-containing protein [Candidatus Neomarinimicrobiota bacterium]